MASAVSPNQHVHFAHDEVTLIIVLGSDNQFTEMKDGFTKSTPPLATTSHRLSTKNGWLKVYQLVRPPQKKGGKGTLTLATTGHNSTRPLVHV